MGKGIKRKEMASSHHELIIKAIGDAYFDKKVRVDFTPQVKESHLTNLRRMDQNIAKSILPTFNNDKLHFTPCFHIPALNQDTESYLQRHNSKIQKFSQIDQPDILIPKPRNRFYCHVCEINFQDYYDHIHEQSHIESQNKSKFHQKIMKLCKKIYKINLERNSKQTQDLSVLLQQQHGKKHLGLYPEKKQND